MVLYNFTDICKTLNVRGKDFEETVCLSKIMVLQYFTFHNYKLWMVYVFLICDATEYLLLSRKMQYCGSLF